MANYLTPEEIIAINKETLAEIKAKKADSFKVLSSMKISKLLEAVEAKTCNIYDKAVVLLKGLVQEHPFASGNRRTAMLAVIRFLRFNCIEPKIKEEPKILQGVRENYYKDEEIKSWLQGGDMREFKR